MSPVSIARPAPTWAASWRSSEAQMPSSPCRCSAVASTSQRRTSARSRYSPRSSSSERSREYCGCLMRSPSGVSSWTRSGCCGRWGETAPGTGSITSAVWSIVTVPPPSPDAAGVAGGRAVCGRLVAPGCGATHTHGDTTPPRGRSAQPSPRRLRRKARTSTSSHVRLSSMAGNADPVDATDARLLLALADDPRASVMALSQRLGLARNTVQTRLTRLESNGVLAPLDRRVRPEALGYRLTAYVTVQVIQRSLADVSDALAHIPEVLEVTGLSGVADLLVEVAARDADDLWRITEQVLAIPGVQRTDTALALRRFVEHRLGPLLERAAGEEAAP